VFLSSRILNTEPLFSLNLRDQVLQPHKTGKIITIIWRFVTIVDSWQKHYVEHCPCLRQIWFT
jgi:hypothetical protein